MSLNSFPSKVAVMGWNAQSLADYMRKLQLSGCDKVVMKGSTTGAQFLQMTDCDLQVFPGLYRPLIAKIQIEINNGEQRRASDSKSKAKSYPKQAFEEQWDSDEFGNESECDYEGLDHEEGDRYSCALTEPQTSKQQRNNEPLACAAIVRPPEPPRWGKLMECHSTEPVLDLSPGERISKPPLPSPRMNHTPQRPLKPPASNINVHSDMSKKLQPGPFQTDLPKSKGIANKLLGSFTSKRRPPQPPISTDVSNRASKLIPCPPVPTHCVRNSLPETRKDLDPMWYGGKITRHEAEAALKNVNKDGAFVVRDSSKGFAEHPYTLMLLKQDKVYNIQIRNQGNSYTLGTGLRNTKSFPGVKEMITHHTHTPMLLIDATNQSSEAQSWCCLLHPVGH